MARRSLRERRVRRLAELAVRAWRGWRAFVTRIRAAGAMRLRATVRFVKPAFTAWRIVALARARSRVVEAMRIDAASRHAMWRAWRAWSLGPALAAFTAGAPTPAPPVHGDDDAGVADSPPGDAPVAVERRRVAPANDYFAVTRPASSPLAPSRSPSRPAAPGPGGTTPPRATPSCRDVIASAAAARAVKTRAAFATWRRARTERLEQTVTRRPAEEAVSAFLEAADEEAPRGSRRSLPFFDRRRGRTTEEPEEEDGQERVEDGVEDWDEDGDQDWDEDGENRKSVPPRIEPAPSDSALDDPPTWRDAERELREASDALLGDARPYPRDDPATSRDWFLAEDRSRAVAVAERARAAATEAARVPAYAAADPEVVLGAARELRASGRWTDPRTVRHGTSDVGLGRGRGGRPWR